MIEGTTKWLIFGIECSSLHKPFAWWHPVECRRSLQSMPGMLVSVVFASVRPSPLSEKAEVRGRGSGAKGRGDVTLAQASRPTASLHSVITLIPLISQIAIVVVKVSGYF